MKSRQAKRIVCAVVELGSLMVLCIACFNILGYALEAMPKMRWSNNDVAMALSTSICFCVMSMCTFLLAVVMDSRNDHQG